MANMLYPFINATMTGAKEKHCNCWKIFLTMPKTIINKTII